MERKVPFGVWKVSYNEPYEGEIFSSLFTTEKKALKFLEQQVKDGYERENLEIDKVFVY